MMIISIMIISDQAKIFLVTHTKTKVNVVKVLSNTVENGYAFGLSSLWEKNKIILILCLCFPWCYSHWGVDR